MSNSNMGIGGVIGGLVGNVLVFTLCQGKNPGPLGAKITQKSVEMGNALGKGQVRAYLWEHLNPVWEYLSTTARNTKQLLLHKQAVDQQIFSARQLTEDYKQAGEQLQAIDRSHQVAVQETNQQIADTGRQIGAISANLQETAQSVSRVTEQLAPLNTSISQANTTLNQIHEHKEQEIRQLKRDKEIIMEQSKSKILELKAQIKNLEQEKKELQDEVTRLKTRS